MHSEQNNEITTVEWVRRQISNYPDSEEKRRVQNLAEKVDMSRKGIIHRINKDGDSTEEFMNRQEQFFELWWEFEEAMGRLKATHSWKAVERRRWVSSYVMSIIALVVAIVSLIITIST